MKIMLYNIGYSLGLNGSIGDYLLYSHRYLYCPQQTREKVMREISEIVCENTPDICTFLEFNQGNLFREGLNKLAVFLNRDYGYFDIENKYGQGSLLRKISFFNRRCNAVVCRERFQVRKHYLSSGVKKLVFEVVINQEFSVFIVHFSLRRQARTRQIQELKELICRKKKVIVCGDFNIFGGIKELSPLLKKMKLRVVNKKDDHTFPSCNPRISLDLFLCSKNIRVKGLQVIPTTASDHLPVLVEVEM